MSARQPKTFCTSHWYLTEKHTVAFALQSSFPSISARGKFWGPQDQEEGQLACVG